MKFRNLSNAIRQKVRLDESILRTNYNGEGNFNQLIGPIPVWLGSDQLRLVLARLGPAGPGSARLCCAWPGRAAFSPNDAIPDRVNCSALCWAGTLETGTGRQSIALSLILFRTSRQTNDVGRNGYRKVLMVDCLTGFV